MLLAIAGFLTAVAIYRMADEAPGEGPAEEPAGEPSEKVYTPFASYYVEHPDDGEAVARIGDTVVYRGDIRRIIAFRLGWESVDPSIPQSETDQDALHQTIVPEIDFMIWDEATRQAGFIATDAEVDEYLAGIREICERDGCEYIAWHGLTLDEYFEYQRENTRQFLARRAFLQSRAEEFPDRRVTWDTLHPELREAHPVLWLDPALQAIYERALADPEVNFEN